MKNVLRWIIFLGDIVWQEYVVRYFSTTVFLIKINLLGIKLGKNPKIFGKVHFLLRPGSQLHIGHHFWSANHYLHTPFNYMPALRIKTFSSKAIITIGNHVDINSSSLLCRCSSITIGDHTMIAPNCIITDSDFHSVDPQNRQDPGKKFDRPVTIGKNVWIGMNCLILKGVTIGDNSVVGAGSVVSKSIPPNIIAAGNPAVLVKSLS